MFIVYSMQNCPHCVGAKELLKARGHSFQVLMAGEDFTREELIERLGPVRTLPQIVLEQADGSTQYIGGFTDLQKHLAG